MDDTGIHADSPLRAPLTPEIWNLAVIAVLCCVIGWAVRLVNAILMLVDVRDALSAHTVLQLKHIRSDMSVLRNISMWHLEQVVRARMEASAVKTKAAVVPFDIPPSSICISRGASPDGASTMTLSFHVQTQVSCIAQIFWGVSTDALDSGNAAVALKVPRTSEEGHNNTPRMLWSLLHNAPRAAGLHSISTIANRIQQHTRRHRLEDDASAMLHDEGMPSQVSSSLARDTTNTSFLSCSGAKRFEAGTVSPFSAAVPPCVLECPPEELQSLREEMEQHDRDRSLRPHATGAPRPPQPRYAAVLIVTSADATPSITSDRPPLTARGPGLPDHNPPRLVADAHWVALDFLPTPLKPERFSPAVARRLAFIGGTAFSSQEIYGRDMVGRGECVICLEGALSIVLLPCRHLCVCATCLQEIDRCPICRTRFHAYLSCGDSSDASAGGASKLHIDSDSDRDASALREGDDPRDDQLTGTAARMTHMGVLI